MGQEWWTFPRIDNFGTIDPAGPYWKPDTNVQLPGNYPITALLPGTVTSVQQTSWGQNVVTIKLDKPVNSLATHTFYEHMSSSKVSLGQHVRAGDLVGYNNPKGAVPLGFGLYSGDVYGSGPSWQVLQDDLKPGGKGLLNPTSLLNKFAGSAGSTSKTGQPLPTPAGGCTAPSSIADVGGTIGFAICMMHDQFVSFGEHIAIFVLGLVLIIVGLLLIGFKPVENAATKVGKAAMLA